MDDAGEAAVERTSFIVRISRHASGRVTGVIERVRTGEKERFDGLEGVGAVMGRMVAGTTAHVKER